MARYTFICEHFDYDIYRSEEMDVASKHTTEFRADDLNTMLQNFELFLRGAGFHFDGTIDIVNEEEGRWDDEWHDCDEEDSEEDEVGSRVMSSMVDDMIKNPFTMDMPGTLGSAKITFPPGFEPEPIGMLTSEQIQLLVREDPIRYSLDDSIKSER
jgi:hypothetical protein